jgi:hypothetical protein
MMAEKKMCQQCGNELPENTPSGECPKCIMKLGLATQSEVGNQAAIPTHATPPAGFIAPEPGVLGEHFPQLEIQELLGQGGMGAVYRARQKQLDRIVALKILPPEIGEDPAFAERFAREARSLARLNHPHIVTLYEFGQTESGQYYFIMEFVDGTDLRHIIRTGTLSAHDALAIVPQICEAMQYAHEQGVVHRDIKPENILLDKKGYVKIGDFGLAKLLDTSTAAYTLTQTGQRMGTPHYMAPEQVEGGHVVDHRADIYSLGVVFYEMLTGQLPIGRFAAPSEKVQVDVRLDKVVLKSLEHEPERRYQHVSEVKTEIDDIASLAEDAQPGRRSDARSPIEPDPQVSADVQQRLRIPAIGLIISGAISLLLVVLLLGWTVFLGGPAILELSLLTLMFGVGSFTIVGALSMMRLQSYRRAVRASIVAMLPVAPGCILGLPMGIWALVVLSGKEVNAGFASHSSRPEQHRKPVKTALVVCVTVLTVFLLTAAIPIGIYFMMSINTREFHRPGPLTIRSGPGQPTSQTSEQKIGDLHFPVGTWDYIEFGPTGPTLTESCAQTLDLKPSESLAVNDILQQAYQGYLALEASHTTRQRGDNQLTVTIAPFHDQALAFLERLWSDLDAVLDPRKQAIARRHLPFGRLFGTLQFGEPAVILTMSQQDKTFRYELEYQWPKSSSRSGGGTMGAGPALPPEYQRFWDEAQSE